MSKKKSICLALLTMLLWGSLFPMVKLGFSAFAVESTADILLFAGIRFFLCGGVICLISAARDKASYRSAAGALFPILMSGVFSIVLHYSLSYAALMFTDSSKTALIKQVGSLFYVCFSFLFIKEDKPTFRKVIAAVGGFLGIVALNITATGFSFHFGDVLILASSFCLIISNVISKHVLKNNSPMTTTGISQFFGGAVLLVVGLLLGGKVEFRLDASLLIMLYICAASIVSYCLWYRVIKSGELSKLLIIKFAEPAFACLFGALILGENIWKLQYLVAFLLISGSIWFSNRKTH